MTEAKYPEDCVKVLNHGFVKLVDHMGDDSAIVQAARVSYGVGTKTVNEDRGLIRRLMRDAHTSPFEMVEFKFHCRMPIFVARQWIRHRTASVNEYSGRYSEMPDLYWLPEEEIWYKQSSSNKQGSSKEVAEYGSGHWSPTNIVEAEQFVVGPGRIIEDAAFDEYKRRLENGVSRELARSCLPLSIYTEWYWKIDLHNLFHFLRLRLDTHAQYEIRVYGEVMAAMIKSIIPSAYEAWEDYVLNSMRFSRMELKLLQQILIVFDHESQSFSDEYLTSIIGNKTEVAEFKAKLEKIKQL